MDFSKDQIVEGVISGITTFGAFVKINNEVTGLVHISEVSSDFVKDIKDIYKIGDAVKVKVLKVEDNGKLVLSIKKAQENAGNQAKSAPFTPFKKRVQESVKPENFEDKLAKFLKESEEIQLDARRSQDLSRKKKKKN
ncbi:MAG: S1 RNA binding domain protein [Fusobacteria bacterium]|nr:MAG: S1 RNA binding domain protein [Fusobacteriota bacterium]KAF0228862.1 MAG: S1 RNA binding domain [Fusobacteriota bacterium]